MKIKTDFVTNSSSTSFILSIRPKAITDFIEYCTTLHKTEEATNEGVYHTIIDGDIKDLKEYTSGREEDWASKPRGVSFNNLTEEEYNICKTIIEEGHAVALASVDYNVVRQFCDNWDEYIVESSE
jgi:hypothetical protein